MTLAEARTRYTKYVAPDDELDDAFLTELNDLLQRIFDSGKWNGLVTEIVDSSPTTTLTLAAGYESILAAQFDGSPVTVFGSYHEFAPGGPGEISEPENSRRCLIDNGDRTYKVVGAGVDEIRARVKRRFIPLVDETDTLPISNPGALKLGFMSLNYEDKGDLESADAYFARALAVLNGELKEARGGAQSTVQMSPHGLYLGGLRRPY